MTRITSAFLLCLVTALRASAQSVPIDHEAIRATRVVTAVKITEKITLDGHLDEAVWMQAVPATDFFQKLPNNGAPASERTEVRFAYDEDNLYIGVTCWDSEPSKLLIKDLREDFEFMDTDLVQVFIDSLHDGISGFTFVVNPAGARRDTQVSNNGGANQDWDGVWNAKTSRNAEAWFIEYAIPFKTLRFTNAAVQEWGLNLTRRIMHLSEENNWSPVPTRFSGNRPSLAATLRGLENIRPGRNLKIKPFVIAGGTQTRVGGPMRSTNDFDGGFDFKYSLTPALTFDATYRTDFAQVEVDQQQVNLTRFNLFFPEKRDFFLENAGNFTFGGVGQAVLNGGGVNFVPFFSRRIGLSAAGTPVPIVGGGRVSGKAAGYDIGVLAMKTDRSGSTSSNTYFVNRATRRIGDASWVGAIVTDRESALAGDYNRVYGPDVHLQLDRVEIDSFVLRSDTPGKTGRNQARKFQALWRDDELSVTAEYNTIQANFNPEMGFVRRSSMAQYSGDVSWHPFLRRNQTIRNLRFGSSIDYFNDDTGKIETRTQEANAGVQFENNGSVNFTVNQTFDRLVNPFAIRPSVRIATGDYEYTRYTASANSGNNRKVGLSGNVGWGEFWNGTNESMTAGLDWRPNYHVNLEMSYRRNHVTLPNGEFTTQLVGARLLYGFNPRTFFNAFIQYNADTHQVSSNLRFNFIHHPLSDLYLVYNDRRDTSGGQLVERVVILKVTNLFNF